MKKFKIRRRFDWWGVPAIIVNFGMYLVYMYLTGSGVDLAKLKEFFFGDPTRVMILIFWVFWVCTDYEGEFEE